MKTNCWEVKNCGRQPGGAKVGELGACPAAMDTEHNNGINAVEKTPDGTAGKLQVHCVVARYRVHLLPR